HLDERLGGGAILALCLPPHGPLEHGGILIDRNRLAETPRKSRAVIAHVMRIVELVAAHAHLPFEPAAALLLAGKQRPIRSRHFGPVVVRDRITKEVSRRGSLADGRHLAVPLLLNGSQEWRWRCLTGLGGL